MPHIFGNTSLLALAAMLVTMPAWSDEARFNGIDRVVAIADVHGAFDAMVTTLTNAGILDENRYWAGGDAHLVVVGDILDRGPDSRAAMDLLMRLEGEAEAAAGRVHVLIGNHESMLLTGDMRYVSVQEYAAFADEQDAADRDRWFALYAQRIQQTSDDSLRTKFDEKFPPGYFAMRRAFRADGKYGSWLLQKNIIAVINGTAFVHGGLSPLVGKIGLDGVNVGLRRELADYVRALNFLHDEKVLLPTDSHYDYDAIVNKYAPSRGERSELLHAIAKVRQFDNANVLDMDGPLWYRGNVSCPGIVEQHRLATALAGIDAERVVVGHTPTPNRQVLQRFDGRIIEIDTGMLEFYYRGSGNALILQGGELTVLNQFGAAAGVPLPHPRSVGRRSGKLSTGALQTLLTHGEILSVEKASRTLVQVGNGKHTVSAVFSKRKSKGFYPGVAAYRMDRLLDLDMVLVTVMREVDGVQGSLQFMPDKRTDEAERSASGRGSSALCPITEQWAAMYVFDVLIFNEGRSQRRMLYDLSSWRLMLSEHDRAFASKQGRPAHLKHVAIAINDGWGQALSDLTDEVIAEHFSDVLDKRRRRALAARRDELLALKGLTPN